MEKLIFLLLNFRISYVCVFSLLQTERPKGARPTQKSKKIAGIDQDEIDDPTILADSDSCFCTYNGVQIHHKICDAELSEDSFAAPLSPSSRKRVGFPMILLHGFGASVYSWSRVMKPLAMLTGSKVLGFDRPAFGLTSRVMHPSSVSQVSRPLNPYSMMFSALATMSFVDFLAADKAILIGYDMLLSFTFSWKDAMLGHLLLTHFLCFQKRHL